MKLRHIGLALLSLLLIACNDQAATAKEQTAASDMPAKPHITVYKSPTCGCCGKWVEHLEQEGFSVTSIDKPQMSPVKQELGIPGQLHSCHSATVAGYTLEGHVPAASVKRLLAERPAISGLAVPGMPLGSPGMEHPEPEAYAVIAYTSDGKTVEFDHYLPGRLEPSDTAHHDHSSH